SIPLYAIFRPSGEKVGLRPDRLLNRRGEPPTEGNSHNSGSLDKPGGVVCTKSSDRSGEMSAMRALSKGDGKGCNSPPETGICINRKRSGSLLRKKTLAPSVVIPPEGST